MNAALFDKVLIVITSPPALERQLVDWLMSQDDEMGFSSGPIHGHSSSHGHLSVAEQVSGRQRRLQFQVQLGSDRLAAFLDALKSEFSGADLHYWVVPVVEAGHLHK